MLRLLLVIVVLAYIPGVWAEPPATTRPATSRLAIYLPAEPPPLKSDYSIAVEVTNRESETIRFDGGASWQYLDPSRDDIRTNRPSEWRIVIAFYSPSGPVPSGGSWRTAYSPQPVSVEPGNTAVLLATAPSQVLPSGPIHIRAVLQHRGETVAASPEVTITRRN